MKKYLNKNLLSYILGMAFATIGIAFCTKANLGLSMIAATPYIISKYFSSFAPWITQGRAEYIWNLIIIIVLAIVVKKWKWSYLLAFVTSVFVGKFIDLWLFIFGHEFYELMIIKVLMFCVGTFLTSLGIAFYFRTTYPCQAYELFVKEYANNYHTDITKTKRYYDYITLIIDVILALLLFKGFVGVGLGTVIITILNNRIIGLCSKFLDKIHY